MGVYLVVGYLVVGWVDLTCEASAQVELEDTAFKSSGVMPAGAATDERSWKSHARIRHCSEPLLQHTVHLCTRLSGRASGLKRAGIVDCG